MEASAELLSKTRGSLATLNSGRGFLTRTQHNDSLSKRRPGETQLQRQLVRLKKEPVHSTV